MALLPVFSPRMPFPSLATCQGLGQPLGLLSVSLCSVTLGSGPASREATFAAPRAPPFKGLNAWLNALWLPFKSLIFEQKAQHFHLAPDLANLVAGPDQGCWPPHLHIWPFHVAWAFSHQESFKRESEHQTEAVSPFTTQPKSSS